ACPLLVDNACSMYPARPFNCRAYHSLDRDACLASFNHPEDPGLTHPQSALLPRINEGVQLDFIDLLDQAGADTRQYELVTALDEALHDPDAEGRHLRGEAAFQRALQPGGARRSAGPALSGRFPAATPRPPAASRRWRGC